MEGPGTEYGNKRQSHKFSLICEVGYILGTQCPEGWWLSGLCCTSRFGNCQHLDNPDAVMVERVCIERT